MIMRIGAPVLAEDLTSEPQSNITERQVDKLAELYNRAVERRDFEAWRELLSPLYPWSPKLNTLYFAEQMRGVESLSAQDIDGMNVRLRIRYASGNRETGLLQLDPQGRIKYTPFCFKHPLYRIGSLLEVLLKDQTTLMGATSSSASRINAANKLASMNIPLFSYDPFEPSIFKRRTTALKILNWLEENGREYDTTEPKLFLPAEEFDALIARLKRAAL
jgi:hypothetical protein